MKTTISILLALALCAALFVGCAAPEAPVDPIAGNEPAADPADTPVEDMPMPDAPIDPIAGNEPAADPADTPVEDMPTLDANLDPDAASDKAITMELKQKTVNAANESFMIFITNNSTEHYSYDYVNRLEKKDGESYSPVAPQSEAVAMALLHIPAGETQEYEFVLAGYYENLEPGSYRIVKTFVSDAGEQVNATLEFEIF